METVARARAVGGSLVITIPKEIVDEEDIHEGELLKIDFKKAKKSGFGIFKGTAPFTTEDELDTHD